MKYPTFKRTPLALLSALTVAATPLVRGQAANPSTEPDEDTIVLSPFVVESTEDADSYRATATLAGTRIRTELKDVGSAISVVTSKFLQDTGATSSDTLLQYTTNTEVGGAYGNFSGTGGRSDASEPRLRPHENTRVRGLARADNSRDFFLTDIPWDSYNVGRIDLQRGPNSILFGIGSPAGMVNASTNGAAFQNANTVEARFGSFGSYRASLDLNRELLDDELAIRVAGVNDKTFYKQDPAFSHQQRAYGALRFDPKWFAKGSARTSIKVSYEAGEIDANRPRITPPRDSITPWFTDPTLAKKLYDARTISDNSPEAIANDPTRTAGANNRYLPDNVTPNPNYSAWLQNGAGGGIFGEPVAWFDNVNSSQQNGIFEPALSTTGKPALPPGVGIPWTVYMGITNYRTWAEQGAIQLPGTRVGAVRTPTLQDRRIFDFYNHLIDGPNKRELTDFEAFNAALSQTFLDNRVGFEVAFDKQSYNDEASQLLGRDPLLTVDIMRVLPDGRPNPNAGRAFVAGLPNSDNQGRWSDRQAVRITAFAEFNFKDIMDESRLSRILGRHVFTGLYMNQRRDLETRGWYNFVHNEDYKSGIARTLDSRRVNSIHYLSPSLVSASLPDLGIDRIRATQLPTTGTNYDFDTRLKPGAVPDANGNYTFNDLIGWDADPNTPGQQGHHMRVLDGYSGRDRAQLYNNATKTRDDVESKALVWQGFFFDGVLVPTVGFRKDEAENFNAGDVPQDPIDQSRLVDDPRWTIPSGPRDPRLNPTTLVGPKNERYARAEGDSTSWSVVLHTPRSIRERLPFGSNLSLFYNRSDNFEALTGRTDVYGNTIPNPTGKTKDYGVMLSVLDERLSFKINWYETSVANATIESGTGSLQAVYRIGLNENWGRAFANWARLGVPGTGFDNNYALTDPAQPEGPGNPRIDPSVAVLRYQPAPNETVAQALQRQNNAINTLLGNPPPANLAAHWNIQLEQNWAGGWGTHVGATQPGSLAVTGDTFSKGVEYEVVATPVPNWNIAINASKTTATRSNLAQGFAQWAEERAEFFRGPGGQVQLWNGNWGQQTVGGVWLQEFYSSFQLYKQLEGSEVAELRPWRVNVITNYSFRQGLLKGVNVGGAYRWQDKAVIGFGLANAGTPQEAWDINKKYYGPAEESIDLWIGYGRKLTEKIDWRIQLNVRNVFADDDLIPISTQPDGSMAVGRIPEPTTWSIANTFRF
jgi:hypothetical protein